MVIFGMRPFAICFHTKLLTFARLEVEGFYHLEDYKKNMPKVYFGIFFAILVNDSFFLPFRIGESHWEIKIYE
jgi:hypothetical protein